MRVKALNLDGLTDNPFKHIPPPPPPPDKGGEGSPENAANSNSSQSPASQHANYTNNINSDNQSTKPDNQNTDNSGSQSNNQNVDTGSHDTKLANDNNQNVDNGGEKVDGSGEYGHALIPLLQMLGGGDRELEIKYKVEGSENSEKSGEFNTIESFTVHFGRLSDSAKKTMFWDILSRLAAESDVFETDKVTDTVRFSSRAAIRRMILGRPINSCYTHREKQGIVMVLDDSGSMDWWAENVIKLAELAVEREDIDVYLAPNGYLMRRLDRRKRDYVAVEHDKEIGKISGFVVLYVGDYDGRGGVYHLSLRNSVIWICPEFRAKEPKENDMAGDDCPLRYRRQFRGVFIRIKELADVFYYLARIPVPVPSRLVIDDYYP